MHSRTAELTQLALLSSLREIFVDVHDLKRELSRDLAGAVPAGALAVLSVLHDGGPNRVSRVADLLHVDVSVASRHIRALEDQGLVWSRRLTQDRRAYEIALTPQGELAVERLAESVRVRLSGALDHWSRDQVCELDRLLARLHHDLAGRRCTTPG